MDVIWSLLAFGVMASSYYGYGALVLTGLGVRPEKQVLAAVVSGWCVSLALAMAVHLVLPLDAYMVSILHGAGLLLAVPVIKRTGMLKGDLDSRRALGVVAIIVIAFWCACKGMMVPLNGDSLSYHFNSVRWANEYAIVPGLGNLHGRLAFNQTFFLYVASLNLSPWFVHGHNLANSFWLMVAASSLVWRLAVAMPVTNRHSQDTWVRHVLHGGALLILVHVALTSTDVSSPTPDFASTVLQIIFFVLLFDWLSLPSPGEQRLPMGILLALLGVTMVTVKLSNLGFIAGGCLVAGGCCLRQIRQWRRVPRQAWWCIGLLLLVVVLWIARGVVTSGYPLYPVPVARVPVDWGLPRSIAVEEMVAIKGWARQPGPDYRKAIDNWDWLPGWWERVSAQQLRIVLPTVMAAGIALFIAFSVVLSRLRWRQSWWLLAPPICGLVYWFAAAPDPRFAGELFWLSCLASVMIAVDYALNAATSRRSTIAAGILCLVAIAPLLWSNATGLWRLGNIRLDGYAPVPTMELERFISDWGVEFWVPADKGKLGDSPLPASPYRMKGLRLRTQSLQDGFQTRQR